MATSVRVARYRRETFETTVFARLRRKKKRDMGKDGRRKRERESEMILCSDTRKTFANAVLCILIE